MFKAVKTVILTAIISVLTIAVIAAAVYLSYFLVIIGAMLSVILLVGSIVFMIMSKDEDDVIHENIDAEVKNYSENKNKYFYGTDV